jgi:hypothetical protein
MQLITISYVASLGITVHIVAPLYSKWDSKIRKYDKRKDKAIVSQVA